MEQLNFISTYTVEQFKANHLVDTLRVKQNPTSGKLFFTYGANTGAISQKGLPSKPLVPLVHASLTREPSAEEREAIGRTVLMPDGRRIQDPRANGFFYLVHEEGQGAPTIAEF
jgi:hypothetical protein